MLPELQSRFYDAMMADSDARLADDLRDLVVGENATLQRRLAAYRRNAYGNLAYALATSYPVVNRIVGGAFFREAARRYIPLHPSTSGDLNDYGAAFPDFIAAYPHAQNLPYLADVARLEWAVQSIRSAADPGPPDLELLSQLSPQRYGELCLTPDSRCVRMDFTWPIAMIWRVNQEDYSGDMTVDFGQAERVLITVHGGCLAVAALSQGEAIFFDALRQGEPLAAAAEQSLDADEAFDYGATLQQWLGQRLLCSATLP
jgi:hypothetical protein